MSKPTTANIIKLKKKDFSSFYYYITKERMLHMSETKRSENKMGVVPIPKLLVQMSLPIMLSMLVQALYNIVECKE